MPGTNTNRLTTRIVPPHGPIGATICFIGEAPGEVEDRCGLPFQGPAGQFHDRCLSQVGIVRSETLHTNLFNQRPPKNNAGYFFQDSKCTKLTWEGEEHVEALRMWLESLRTNGSPPNILVSLGRHAMRFLTGKSRINKWRGSVVPCTLSPGYKVYIMYHPSYVNRLINEKERQIVAYHEVGHALVALNLSGTDPVQKISIVPRGLSALGYTLQVPTEDRFLMNKSELLNKIAVALGGRAAEEISFEDISTGAHNDLSRATDIARSMVKEYGMSETLGHVYFEKERQGQFADMGLSPKREYSEETAEAIDREVKAFLDAQYDVAKEILTKHKDVLEKGAALVLKEEKIEGKQLKALLDADPKN